MNDELLNKILENQAKYLNEITPELKATPEKIMEVLRKTIPNFANIDGGNLFYKTNRDSCHEKYGEGFIKRFTEYLHASKYENKYIDGDAFQLDDNFYNINGPYIKKFLLEQL